MCIDIATRVGKNGLERRKEKKQIPRRPPAEAHKPRVGRTPRNDNEGETASQGKKVAYTAPSIEEYIAGEVVKYQPKSEGTSTKRKRKPHILAVINENCTGCAGSPACVEYCPVEDCMYWSPDPDHAPFGRIIVDPLLCIGCKLCTSKGPDGAFLEGCPWDAIDMVPLAEFEGNEGALPY
jgi:ferredoxin